MVAMGHVADKYILYRIHGMNMYMRPAITQKLADLDITGMTITTGTGMKVLGMDTGVAMGPTKRLPLSQTQPSPARECQSTRGEKCTMLSSDAIITLRWSLQQSTLKRPICMVLFLRMADDETMPYLKDGDACCFTLLQLCLATAL